MKPGFYVGLVKTWKRHIRVHGDEQSVDVLTAVVLVFKTGDSFACGSHRRGKVHDNLVLSGAQSARGQFDVAIRHARRDGRAVDYQMLNSSLAKIEHDWRRCYQPKTHLFMTASVGSMRRKRIAQPIPHIRDLLRPLPGQITGNAFRNLG